MSHPDDRRRLHLLAVLYLRMAHQSDDYLSDSELESVTLKLAGRSFSEGGPDVRHIVMESLQEYLHAADANALAEAAADQLDGDLTTQQKRDILDDLRQIAEADGVLLKHEREMLRAIAGTWGIEMLLQEDEGGNKSWGVLHDLAYIYLVLAHSTDHDLSETEMHVMLNKLQEWQPQVSRGDVKTVLSGALNAYAEGEDQERLEHSIQSVRRTLPRKQRMAALNDLVKIANADGVFLDNEEDLINHLLSEWDVDPYANYGRHGSKE